VQENLQANNEEIWIKLLQAKEDLCTHLIDEIKILQFKSQKIEEHNANIDETVDRYRCTSVLPSIMIHAINSNERCMMVLQFFPM